MSVHPWRGPAGQHARRGESLGRRTEHSLPGISLPGGSGRDWHGQDVGGIPGSILCLAARHAEQEEIDDTHVPSLAGHNLHGDFMSTSRTSAQTWEHLENKGSEEAFFSR